MTWHVATVPGARDAHATPEIVEWEQLVYVLTHPTPHPGDPDDKATKERITGWIPARLNPQPDGTYRRRSDAVAEVSCLVLDLDSGEPLTRARDVGRGFKAIFHTSWSCSPAKPKGRLVLPFAEPCPVARWAAVWRAGARFAASFGVTVDPAAKDPCRLYFLPAVPEAPEHARRAGYFRSWVNDGEGDSFLHWRYLLAGWPDPPQAQAPRPVMPTLQRELSPASDGGKRAQYVRGIVRRRLEELSSMSQGGRNLAAFRAGAVLGQLDAAGALNADSLLADFVAAATCSGLDAGEADLAIRNGIARGRRDGPFTFPTGG